MPTLLNTGDLVKMRFTEFTTAICSSIFISVLASYTNLHPKGPSLISRTVVEFMVKSQLKESTIFGEKALYLICDNSKEAESMAQHISKTFRVPILLLKNEIIKVGIKNIRPCLTFILLREFHEIDAVLNELLSTNSFRVNIPAVMVVCRRIDEAEEREIDGILRRVWTYGLHRFIVIYVSDNIHVKRFNPFKYEIREVPPNKSEIFKTQMRNMYGYKLRVGLFEEWPILKRDVNWMTMKKVWIGRDVTLLSCVMRYLNATYRVVEPPSKTRYKGAISDILQNKTDMCFVRHFQTVDYDGIEFGDYNDLTYLQVIVPGPRRLSQSRALLNILHRRVWIAFVLSLIILVSFVKLVINVKQLFNFSLMNFSLDILGMFLGVAQHRLNKYGDVLRICLTVWIWSSLILNVSFQSRLLNLIEFVEYEEGIRNLKDLERSEIPIYTPYNLTKLTGNPQLFQDQLRSINYTDIPKVLWRDKPNAAFVVSFGSIRGYPNPDLYPRKATISHVLLPEPLSYSYSVYLFRKHSPFSRRIAMAILELRQFGFAAKPTQNNRMFQRESGGLRRLSLREIEAPLLILSHGLLLCVVIFVVEFILHPPVWRLKKP